MNLTNWTSNSVVLPPDLKPYAHDSPGRSQDSRRHSTGTETARPYPRLRVGAWAPNRKTQILAHEKFASEQIASEFSGPANHPKKTSAKGAAF